MESIDTPLAKDEPVRAPWTTPRLERLGDMSDVRNSQQSGDDGMVAGQSSAGS